MSEGKIAAIRVQDVARDVWFNWDMSTGKWDNLPTVTLGSNLYAAFWAVNVGQDGYLRIRIIDDAGMVLADKTVWAPNWGGDINKGVGVETGTINMPNRPYEIKLEATSLEEPWKGDVKFFTVQPYVHFPCVGQPIGDVNEDGYVNIDDSILVGKYIGQTVPPAPECCDVNRDWLVGFDDASVIAFHEEASNALKNSGFEEGFNPWDVEVNYSPASNARVALETPGYRGNRCLFIGANIKYGEQAQICTIRQSIPVETRNWLLTLAFKMPHYSQIYIPNFEINITNAPEGTIILVQNKSICEFNPKTWNLLEVRQWSDGSFAVYLNNIKQREFSPKEWWPGIPVAPLFVEIQFWARGFPTNYVEAWLDEIRFYNIITKKGIFWYPTLNTATVNIR